MIKSISSKKWSFLSISLILMICLVLPALLNLLIDPYTIFHTSTLKQELSVNQRFNKIEYLKYNPNKYNSFMLGNSRIGTTHPKALEQYLPNSHFYNLTLSAGNMEDMVIHIEYLIHHNKPIKNIYLQLDYQDMIYWGHDQKNYEYIQHPDVSKISYLKFYSDYLLIMPFLNFKEKISRNLIPTLESKVIQDTYETGMWIAVKKEKMIKNNPQKYIRNEPSFHVQTINIWKKDPLVYTKMLTALQKIVTLSQQNNINLILYTTPYNHAMLNCFQLDDVAQYLEDISKIHAYYFFSDYNSVTMNDENYYESGHFRGIVGELIAAKIFNDPKKHLPSDFCTYITQSNFLSYKEHIKVNFINYRKKLLSKS